MEWTHRVDRLKYQQIEGALKKLSLVFPHGSPLNSILGRLFDGLHDERVHLPCFRDEPQAQLLSKCGKYRGEVGISARWQRIGCEVQIDLIETGETGFVYHLPTRG